jgi:uncharacterized membrane protein YtjA (UPF0391 family)
MNCAQDTARGGLHPNGLEAVCMASLTIAEKKWVSFARSFPAKSGFHALGLSDKIHLKNTKGPAMLAYAFIFLVIALIAAALGFTGIAGVAVGIARFLFFIFLVIFVVLLVLALFSPAVVVTP